MAIGDGLRAIAAKAHAAQKREEYEGYAAELVRAVLATPSEEWRNHIPSAYEDRNSYARIECSCGWDSWNDGDPKYPSWEEHIDAAERIGEALG